MNFNQWLQTLPGSPTPTMAATKSGLASPTLIRHAERGRTTADNVIAIARSYGVSPVDALVDTGFLRPDEIDQSKVSARQALSDLGIDEALRTVVERVNGSGLFEEEFTVNDVMDDLAGRRDDRSNVAESDVRGDDYDDEALIDRINAGLEPIAAQKRTDPLDENYT